MILSPTILLYHGAWSYALLRYRPWLYWALLRLEPHYRRHTAHVLALMWCENRLWYLWDLAHPPIYVVKPALNG